MMLDFTKIPQIMNSIPLKNDKNVDQYTKNYSNPVSHKIIQNHNNHVDNVEGYSDNSSDHSDEGNHGDLSLSVLIDVLDTENDTSAVVDNQENGLETPIKDEGNINTLDDLHLFNLFSGNYF